MALDPDAARVLEMVRLSGRPPYETLTAPEARALFVAAREVLAPDPAPVAEVRELSAPGPGGEVIPMRLYRGTTTASGGMPPALVFFHGGGWVIGDLDTASAATSPMRPYPSSSRWITVSLRSTNFPQQLRTPSPQPHGSPNRQPHSASTASGSPSGATVPAATLPLWSAC